MQKVFIIKSEYDTDNINDFIQKDGKIISVSTQKVSGDNKGNFLVVADDGKGVML